MSNQTHLIGFKHGELTVIAYHGQHEKTKSYLWLCRCTCGIQYVLPTDKVKTTNQCKKHPRVHGLTKHGEKFHPVYRMWCNMKKRCYSPAPREYKYYAGKNIIVCDEWLNDAGAFYKWAMDNGWENGLSIDRIDSNGNYTPENCRFITRSENSRRSLTWNVKRGSILKCVACGIDYYKITSRVKESRYCSNKCRLINFVKCKKV